MQGALLQGGELNDAELADLAGSFAAYTGENCYVTPKCTDDTPGQKSTDQVCSAGFTSVETVHRPYQATGVGQGNSKMEPEKCDKGKFHHICCPTKALPKNCKWQGAPNQPRQACTGSCAPEQFLLNTDFFVDSAGNRDCGYGERYLCCDSADALDQCRWEGCQALNGPAIKCSPQFTQLSGIQRFDQGDGSMCPTDPKLGPMVQPFCCPKKDTYKKCHWGNKAAPPVNGLVQFDAQGTCTHAPCNASQIAITKAQDPWFPTSTP